MGVDRSTGPATAPIAQRAQNVSQLVYPPQDPGLPTSLPAVLLSDQHDLLGKLRLHAALNPELFEQRLEGPIRRVAEYVDVLPGSATTAFSGAGGLFRASLEMAFGVFRASDGRIFTGNQGVEARHRLEKRWRYVCFCAGLLYPLGGALSRMVVLDAEGRKWSPELEGLSEWVDRCQVERLYVSWQTPESAMGPSPLTGTFALKIIGRENIEWLNEGSAELTKVLLDIASGAASAKTSIAYELIGDMWKSIQSREIARLHQNYGALTIGSNIAPYLMDAIIGLSKSEWVLNKVVLFADKTGAYLQWPKAGQDIIAYCRRMGFTGIPANESALLGMLISSKLVEAGVGSLGLSEIADPDGVIVAAVKVSKPGLVLPDDVELGSFSKSRPVLMEAVEAADPLTSKRPNPPAVESAQVEESATDCPPVKPAPTLEQLDISEISDEDSEGGEVEPAGDDGAAVIGESEEPALINSPTVAESSVPEPMRRPAEHARAGGTEAGRSGPPGDKPSIVERGEIRYSDLLPRDLSQKMRPLHAEILGKLVHVWRNKSGEGKLMRMSEHGAAVDLAWLNDLTADPPGFLSALGEQGLIYTAPQTPSKMVYKVPVTEGGQTSITCFILAHHACRRLEIA